MPDEIQSIADRATMARTMINYLMYGRAEMTDRAFDDTVYLLDMAIVCLREILRTETERAPETIPERRLSLAG